MGGRFSLVAIRNGDNNGYAIIVDRYTGSARFCVANRCRNIEEEQRTASTQQAPPVRTVEQPSSMQSESGRYFALMVIGLIVIGIRHFWRGRKDTATRRREPFGREP
jgi:hypothetical protein